MVIEYSQKQLKIIGLHLLSLIRDRTAKGIDKDGKPFIPYSTRPFKIPYAAATKSAVKELVKQGKALIINQNGVTKAIIKTGYLDYKKLVYKDTAYDGTVNLMLTGRMMQDLNVIRIENNQVVIGFGNVQMAERAAQNIRRGRDFLGLSPADLEDARFKQLLAEGFSIQA